MANTPTVSSQSTPDRQEDKSTECPSVNSLAENSQANFDARLDHAIEETFPTSDPVFVTITKGPEPDGSDQGARSSSTAGQQGQQAQNSTEQTPDQVGEALHEVADQASEAVRDVYSRGEHHVQPELNRVAVAVDGTLEIHPATSHRDVGLVDVPLSGDGSLACVEALQKFGRVMDNLSVNGSMVDRDAARGHRLFQVPKAQIVSQVPLDAEQDHGSINMPALEHTSLPAMKSGTM
jgi:hypothetical protein